MPVKGVLVLGGHVENPLAVNSRPRAAASWWFQASKKPLMAALTAARVHTLAAGALEAALGAAAPGLPADGWPGLPVQPMTESSRAGKATSPAIAASPRCRVTMAAVSAQGHQAQSSGT